jgi:hypothetical protein
MLKNTIIGDISMPKRKASGKRLLTGPKIGSVVL